MNWKRHYDIFSILVDNYLFVVEICIKNLYYVTHIFFFTCNGIHIFFFENVQICYYFVGILG